MSEDHLSFIRAICHRPADDLPRLVFADWLEEKAAGVCEACCGRKRTFAKTLPEAVDMARRGSPHTCQSCHGTGTNGAAERAEYIRLSIEQFRTDRDSELYHRQWQRLDELSYVWNNDWFPPIESIAWTRERGFISGASCTIAQFEQYAGRIALDHPVTRWELSDATSPLERLNSPPYAHVYFWPGTGTTIPPDVWMTDYLSVVLRAGYVVRTAKVFPTREAALDALNAACCVVANARAEAMENPEKEEKSVYIHPRNNPDAR